MKKATRVDRFRYQFDNLMSKGTAALIGALFAASALLILLVSLGVRMLTQEGQELGYGNIAWMSLMRTLDSGTMGGDQGSAVFLSGMLAVTLGGIFLVGALIGVLTTGIDSKLGELRKGRSLVVEENHTVILGWSPQVFTILSELATANANQPRSCIAILAEKDKVEMEDEIRSRVGSTGKTRIACRTGSPIDLNDLEIVNPHEARSVIVLSDKTADADTRVIKTVLALTNNPNRPAGKQYHIVAEIRDQKNLDAARLVGKDEAQVVLVDDLVARITAQTCRQSGLSVVYTELLDFGGDEIYFKEEPSLVGVTFGDAVLRYEDSALIGLRFADGRVQLNPAMETTIGPGDRIIAISEDDDTICLRQDGEVKFDRAAIHCGNGEQALPEATLILGWNRRGPALITELDHYAAPGSRVMVVAQAGRVEEEIERCCDSLSNLSVSVLEGDTTDRRMLDRLELASYDHVVTLSYSDTQEEQEADAHTLVTLLHLREIGEQQEQPFTIVSEMLDTRNRELAEVTRADDFIVSDKLVSLLLSQISENKDLNAVFQDLFDPEGSELYLKPASRYVEPGNPVNFYTVVDAARCQNEVAIGYRLHSKARLPAENYGIRVNPEKSEMITFTEQDRVIVLAED